VRACVLLGCVRDILKDTKVDTHRKYWREEVVHSVEE
jgi:hypothetical protein